VRGCQRAGAAGDQPAVAVIDGVVFALFAGVVAMAGKVPQIGGNLDLGLAVAGALNFALFGGLLRAMFRFRALFALEGLLICRMFDRVAKWFRANGAGLLGSLCDGVVWPRDPRHRLGGLLGAIAAKLISATHCIWAGLAVGVVLAPFDYLFLMVFAGFSLVLSRFVRIPGGFIFGSALAFDLLGMPEAQALLMILFNWMMSIIVVVGGGPIVLWQSGLDFRARDWNRRPPMSASETVTPVVSLSSKNRRIDIRNTKALRQKIGAPEYFENDQVPALSAASGVQFAAQPVLHQNGKPVYNKTAPSPGVVAIRLEFSAHA